MTHESWDMRTRRAQHDRWMADAHRRLRHGKLATWRANISTSNQCHRHNGVQQCGQPAHRLLAAPAAQCIHDMLRNLLCWCYSETAHSGKTAGLSRVQCLCSTAPLLATHVGKIYSDAVVSAVDGEADLLDHLGPAGCEAVAVWRAQAELSHLHPCSHRLAHTHGTGYCSTRGSRSLCTTQHPAGPDQVSRAAPLQRQRRCKRGGTPQRSLSVC